MFFKPKQPQKPSQDIIQLGRSSAEFKNSDCYKEVMTALSEMIETAWHSSKSDDREGREELFSLNMAIRAFNAKLDAFIANGEIEKDAVSSKKKQKHFHIFQ